MRSSHARPFARSALVMLAVVGGIVRDVRAHSWLDCLDWDVTTQSCKGYARNWAGKPADPFGTDRGRDNRPSGSVTEGGLVCIGGESEDDKDKYTPQFPRATVAAGQDLVLRWPAKNHANVGTQRGVQLFISRTPDGGDDFGHITNKDDYLQQCTAAGGLCEHSFSSGPDCQTPGVDKAECMATFRLPLNLQAGVYTFMWWWEFNAGEYYNSCADALVTAATDDSSNNGKWDAIDDSSSSTSSSSSSSSSVTALTVSVTVVALAVIGGATARHYHRPKTTPSPALPTAAPTVLLTPSQLSPPPLPPRRPTPQWAQHKDPATGQSYWFDVTTGVSTWERPSVAGPPSNGPR